MKALRGLSAPLAERDSLKQWPEDEAAFERDVAERGAAAASRPVGAGGEAVDGRPRARFQRLLELLHRGQHLLHGGLRVAEQQRGVLVVEERVVDPREARCSSSA